MIPCFSGEREAEGKHGNIDGKEESEVLLKGTGKTEQLFVDWSLYNLFGSRDPNEWLWVVLALCWRWSYLSGNDYRETSVYWDVLLMSPSYRELCQGKGKVILVSCSVALKAKQMACCGRKSLWGLYLQMGCMEFTYRGSTSSYQLAVAWQRPVGLFK